MSFTSSQLRQAFLDYFAEQGHQVVPSSSLVPGNDPTLLFTNAGMVQFKDCFLGKDKRDYVRAASSQRCVRAGGKHNDLENVGYTARHHTFFEMLGNFSFGDYFKKDAIRFGWDFLTGTLKIDPARLMVTVYQTDDEAYDLWHKMIGLPAEKIVRIGDKPEGGSDNFWQMGDTGPCGPCTEIFYDHGPSVAGGPPGSPDADGDRWVEIWNLVFMQFDRAADGKLTPLPKPSVDTGAGLERMSAVMQGVTNNYDIDLFVDLIHEAARLLGTTDYKNPSLRVIADHIRACSFLIVDGVVPSNEGRGYVLRRIARRAMRHGYKFGRSPAFFHDLVPTLAKVMGGAYPELVTKQAFVRDVLRKEGEQFARTLETGMEILDAAIAKLGRRQGHRRQHRFQAPRHLRFSDRPHGRHRARARAQRRHGRLRASDGRAAPPVAGCESVRRRSLFRRQDRRQDRFPRLQGRDGCRPSRGIAQGRRGSGRAKRRRRRGGRSRPHAVSMRKAAARWATRVSSAMRARSSR